MTDLMSDREMLELAARAAGIDWFDEPALQAGKGLHMKSGSFWNPLADDGDALRLAVALRISVMLAETDPCTPDCAYVEALPGGPVWRYVSAKDDDPGAATRRAIVRAAAAIGEEMS